MARFGIGSFRIKSFTADELDITKPEYKNCRIERRQRYFHLAGLPAFGIGKFWQIRFDNDTYEPDDALSAHLNSLDLKIKSPWYTYGFPIFAVLVTLIVLSVIQIKDFSTERRWDKEYAQKRALIIEKITSPSTCDYWKVNHYMDRNDLLLKVTDYDSRGIYFVSLETKYGFDREDWKLYGEFLDTMLTDTIYVEYDSLLTATHADRSEQHWNEGVHFGARKCKIETIHRVAGPYPVCELEKKYPNDYSTLYLTLRNRGTACYLDSISISGFNHAVIDSFPRSLEYGEAIRLSEDIIQYHETTHAKILIYLRDKEQNQYLSTITKNDEGVWFDAVLAQLSGTKEQ